RRVDRRTQVVWLIPPLIDVVPLRDVDVGATAGLWIVEALYGPRAGHVIIVKYRLNPSFEINGKKSAASWFTGRPRLTGDDQSPNCCGSSALMCRVDGTPIAETNAVTATVLLNTAPIGRSPVSVSTDQ